MAKAKSSIWDDVNLPMLEDSASIQVAISQIMAGFLSSRLDARHTGLLLYALQIASQNRSHFLPHEFRLCAIHDRHRRRR
jgi:hypothetical protein